MPSSSAPPVQRIDLSAADLPARLARFDARLPFVDVVGSLEARHAVAIVGTRRPTPAAHAYARQLAAKLARKGAVIVSGGAVGIDAAAHEGALDVGGRTWCVLASTFPTITPTEHADLIRRIGEHGGTRVWIGNGDPLARGHFLQRNRVLVGLADAVIIVEAADRSGSRNSALTARKLGRDLFVVAPSPWLDRHAFQGNVLELTAGYAQPVFDDDLLLEQLGLLASPPTEAAPVELDEPSSTGRSHVELAILKLLHTGSPAVLHVDEIVSKTALPYSAAASALLTLCLEAVVVEGPGGFYRRRPAGLAATVGK